MNSSRVPTWALILGRPLLFMLQPHLPRARREAPTRRLLSFSLVRVNGNCSPSPCRRHAGALSPVFPAPTLSPLRQINATNPCSLHHNSPLLFHARTTTNQTRNNGDRVRKGMDEMERRETSLLSRSKLASRSTTTETSRSKPCLIS